MNHAQLEAFRAIADGMRGPEPTDWEWCGPHMSQRHFGITEKRAREFAARHGGTARKMEVASPAQFRATADFHTRMAEAFDKASKPDEAAAARRAAGICRMNGGR